MIERTTEPTLKRQFQAMIDCPIRDSKGRCRSFSEYILSALIKNGIHRRYDVEAALGYVFEKMMLPVSDAGKPRTTFYGGFTATRPDSPQQLQARFMLFLQYALRNVRKGKIPRLANVEQRPRGSVSIGQGRTQDDFSGTISPDQIAARPSDEGDFNEIISDIMDLLRKKEAATGLPLLGVFQAITAGQNTLAAARALWRRPDTSRPPRHHPDDQGLRREKRQLSSPLPARQVQGLQGESALTDTAHAGQDGQAGTVAKGEGLPLHRRRHREVRPTRWLSRPGTLSPSLVGVCTSHSRIGLPQPPGRNAQHDGARSCPDGGDDGKGGDRVLARSALRSVPLDQRSVPLLLGVRKSTVTALALTR